VRAAPPDGVARRASGKPRVLTGLARCGLCGSSYQLETSGKSLDGATYSYCYYNCRKTLRAGKKACPGFRVRVEDLDGAVLAAMADIACTPERAQRLSRRHHWPGTGEVITAWRNFILHAPRDRDHRDRRHRDHPFHGIVMIEKRFVADVARASVRWRSSGKRADEQARSGGTGSWQVGYVDFRAGKGNIDAAISDGDERQIRGCADIGFASFSAARWLSAFGRTPTEFFYAAPRRYTSSRARYAWRPPLKAGTSWS
jgi:hypothetical protein